MPRRKATDSEVHAYQFIKDELRLLGWDVRNPERADAGQVWTQHEALHNPAINESLKGRVPENVVKVCRPSAIMGHVRGVENPRV